jgi:hypothetical protein
MRSPGAAFQSLGNSAVRKLRPQLSNSPLWSIARSVNDFLLVFQWERGGRPVPPPGGFKRRVLRQFARKYALNTMIETGTLNAEMDLAMKDQFRRIVTIELSPELHDIARKRLARYPHIECLQGDSSIVLPRALANIDEPCLFWLDAHYSSGPTAKGDVETPISAELNAVLNHEVRNHVVLIDDARHFDGTHDYPRIAELKESVARIRPDLLFTLEDDIIRITPNSDRH